MAEASHTRVRWPVMVYEQMLGGPELLQRSAFVGEIVEERPQVVVDDPQLTAVQPRVVW